MKVRFYEYNIKLIDYNTRVLKRYELKFILEFEYSSILEYISKYKEIVKQVKNLYVSELESDNEYYFYIRKKKYLLSKGVDLI